MSTIPLTLNSRWTRAISRPKVAFGPDTASAASNAVIVVPTFAPNVIGNACCKLSRPAEPRGTSSEVVIELD